MNIEKYSVNELSLVEKHEINGGNILWKLLAAVGVAIIEDWDNFKKGLAGEPEIAR